LGGAEKAPEIPKFVQRKKIKKKKKRYGGAEGQKGKRNASHSKGWSSDVPFWPNRRSAVEKKA